ncbi:G-rich domain on putative tyrosine kinase [Xylanibacter ruminicola]|uniref:G-rich domain on putative tyrosine kinase n=1 Tax=Xylanibacter ruminicola TaxID=839 RepID=A0A1H4F3S7_XYLRU|nr:Wzz/FepE/Etk N-terminal domain-containing protein [Xylanibacter ruminicola]SEA91891.1 G-rich domain on putative tyrosine kinase [Xylanibacter ruminicola]
MKERFTLSDFIKVSLNKWKWYATSVVTFLLLAIVYLVVTPPKYTRSAQILVRDEGGMSGIMGQLGGLAELGGIIGFGSSNVYNELYAMQSPWLLLNVVNQLHLDMTYTIKGIRNKDLYAEQLPIIITFKQLTDEDDVSLKMDLNKSGDFKIYKIKKNDDKYNDELNGHVGNTVKSCIGDIEVKATPNLSRMTDEEITITVKRTEPMAVVTRLKKKAITMAVSSRDASIIDIKCKDVSKQRAADIINTIIAEYRKEANDDKEAQSAASERYIVERLASLENELRTLDNRVADYKSKTMMPDLEVMAKVYAEGAKDISTAHLALSNQLYVTQAIRDYLRDESKKDELLPALLITDNKGLADQVGEYNKLQLQRNKIIASSSQNSPLVKDIDQQLSAMHHAVLSSAENAIKQLQLQIKSVSAKESEGKQMLASAPKKAIGGLSDERDWRVMNEVYVFLLQKREEAQMAKALKSDIRVLTPPLGVKKQTSPVKASVLFGALLFGLFVPACVILVRERKKR